MPVPYYFTALSLNDRMERVDQDGEFVSADPAVPSNYTIGALSVEVELDPAVTRIVDVVAFSTSKRSTT